MNFQFEQGPIRPPSEAHSLLLRVTRNCPWNRCEFCHIYKGRKFTVRSTDEVKRDIDSVREMAEEIKSLSWSRGEGGEISASLVNSILQNPGRFPEGFRSVSLWLYGGGETVFLQDADSLCLKTSRIVEILNYLKEAFPSVERVTTYGRAKTISRKTVEELRELYEAGVKRIHIGLETGSDRLLQFVRKGVTAREQIDAGTKVKASGISLSEYVMPGLGGREAWREHATETARVLNEIDPDFIRLRTLKVLQTMPLHTKLEAGQLTVMSDDEIVQEIRLMIERLEGISSALVSDHVLNLLEEVEGRFPEDKNRMIGVIDRYLALPGEEKANFRLGRRAGAYRHLDDLSRADLHGQVEEALERIRTTVPGGLDKVLSEWTESFI
jgi:biotin synthase-like enzyme